jgi:hypothetical protein
MAWFRPEKPWKKNPRFLISEKHRLVLILIGLMLLKRQEADKTVSEAKDRYLLQRLRKVKCKTF